MDELKRNFEWRIEELNNNFEWKLTKVKRDLEKEIEDLNVDYDPNYCKHDCDFTSYELNNRLEILEKDYKKLKEENQYFKENITVTLKEMVTQIREINQHLGINSMVIKRNLAQDYEFICQQMQQSLDV